MSPLDDRDRRRHLSAAEAAVLEALLPEALTPDVRDVTLCLFEALAQRDARCGQRVPDAAWRGALQELAQVALAQIEHVTRQIGGRAVYLAKGVAVRLSVRDRALCAEFNGRNYALLAAKYDLTEMRVRQIINAERAERIARLQGRLPGIDGDDTPDGAA